MNKVQWTVAAALAPIALGAPSFAQPETTAPTLPGTTSNADSKTAAGGFTEVSGLKKDGEGIWRGQAMRDGTSVSVFCEGQGNVGTSQA